MIGCTSQPRPETHIPKIDPTLAQIPQFRWLGDITAIALEWEPNMNPIIKGYRIYRKPKDDKKAPFLLIAQINNRFTSHYIDLHLPSAHKYLYKISTFNGKGLESIPSRIISTVTRPIPRSVSFFTKADERLPRKAKLIWRPHQNGRINGYIMQRKTPAEKVWKDIATLPHRLMAEYIDTDLNDDQVYLYRLIALTFDGIRSTPSDIARITTKALPENVTEINATLKQPQTIELHWKKHPQKDIAFYNIYRSEESDDSFDYYAKTTQNMFIDKALAHGSRYFYQISAVDFDGLESTHKTITLGKTLDLPAKVHLRSKALNKEGLVTLKWDRGDIRSTHFQIKKVQKTGWFRKQIDDFDTNKTTFSTSLQPNVSTYFEIRAFDKYGIASKPVMTEDIIYEKVVE